MRTKLNETESFCRLSSGGVEEEWDDYIARLNSMGLEQYMEIYQRNYTATHSN